MSDFIFLGSKITADGDCRHEIKRRLLLGRKVMTNPDSILKSRDITLPTNVCLVKAMVFPVVMYGCEWELECEQNWAPNNWCFWTVVLEKTLESPLDCKRSNQSILKEISPGCSLKVCCWSWNSNTLAPDVKSWLLWKDSDAGKDWGQEEKGTTEDKRVGWHHWLNGHEFSKLQELVMDREA